MAWKAGWTAAVAAGAISLSWLASTAGCLDARGIPSAADAGACLTAAECDDADPCTSDTCTSAGVCAHTPLHDGPAPAAAQELGSCKQVVCKGGQASTVADPTNAPKAPDMCTVAKCDGEMPVTDPAPDGTACDMGGAPGTCRKGVCKVACTTSEDCPSMGACQTVACNGATGSCEYTNVADGTPTPGVTQTAGDCTQHICLSGQDTAAPDDSDIPTVPAAMAGCADATCSSGSPSFPLHATDSQCSTYMGSMAGFCSATGACVQCTQDSECAATGTTNDCQHPVCTNDACTQAFTDAGTPTTSNPGQVPGDCQQIVCDGAGNAGPSPDATDVPDDPTGCNPGTCTGNPLVPGFGLAPDGTACGNGLSCKSGVCAGCTVNSQCQMGGKTNGKCMAPNCVCTPSTCAALGLTCGTAPDGCGGTVSCNDAKADGTETAVDCGGNTSTCATRCSQGQACKATSDCKSGLTCADGVCCNQACGGSCEACTAAKKGQGVDGVCGAVASGKPDPRGLCKSQAASTCGEKGGTCNGSGACTTWPTGTVCAPASCQGYTLVKAETCVGGACTPASPSTVSCVPYTCVNSACATTCAQDTDCIPVYYCASHQCVPKLASGAPCTTSNQCVSAICFAGHCE